jgi:hypothetical protein
VVIDWTRLRKVAIGAMILGGFLSMIFVVVR